MPLFSSLIRSRRFFHLQYINTAASNKIDPPIIPTHSPTFFSIPASRNWLTFFLQVSNISMSSWLMF